MINVGYNDWAAVYDVDRVMRALKVRGRPDRRLGDAARGDRLRVELRAVERTDSQAASRWRKSLVVADWNAYSRGKPWFREDGLHLTTSGALGLARLLRPLVLAGAASS